MINISRKNSKKGLKRVTTKRKPISLHLQMMSKLKKERYVPSENEILQNSIDPTFGQIPNYQIFHIIRHYLY
jgi:hypothetical protein